MTKEKMKIALIVMSILVVVLVAVNWKYMKQLAAPKTVEETETETA